MDSPLNTAHQHARQAETFVKCDKFENAIESHTRAAELILVSMTSTTSAHALESLKLQHHHHLKKIDSIQEMCNKREKEMNKKLSKGDNSVNKECQTEERGVSIFDQTDAGSPIPVCAYNTLEETDTLLNLLETRCSGLTTNTGVPISLHKTSKILFNKQPKNSQTVIEELSEGNNLLRSHIDQLVNENEILRKENEMLKRKSSSNDDDTNLLCDERHYCQENFYDLPPLEMPTLGPEFYTDPSKENEGIKPLNDI